MRAHRYLDEVVGFINKFPLEQHGFAAHAGWVRKFEYCNFGQLSFDSRKKNEETAYESYMNPEPGFQSGPRDSVDAD